ncbi:MAG: cytochrome c1 [Methylococcaceae bacterium]|nr:cytochrome c1 [Methylococcaceae bacterium]
MKILFAIVILGLTFCAQASEGALPLAEAEVDVFDLPSVHRGAAYFADYCMGCHTIKHLRYSRLAKDLKLTEAELRRDVLGEGGKFHDSLLSALDREDALKWFAVAPPDLSLIARARGADWLYSYLKGFYADSTRGTGVNNAVFKDVAMPNVFWELQGLQKPVFKKHDGSEVLVGLELAGEGKMSPQQFDRAMLDLVNFLVYAAEPGQFDRLRLGKYVVFALLFLSVILYKLKKAYWTDIH